ncbi:MAG: helix-hairpin-helix domain-containing protein [Bacteroidia bacterium]|nr:helix-hairpin-helix domain-containing protein [Bacteroidia bacterium]
MKRYIWILFLFLFPVLLFCQKKDLSEEIISIAEELTLEESNPEAVNMYLEQLHELSENPVNINSADESEISRLFFLSDFQVKALADYITTSGKIVSVFEIASIPGFDRQTVEMIIPFIELSQKDTFITDNFRLHSTFLTNIIIKPGEKDTSCLGPSYKLLSKYKLTAGRFTGGFTLEKDPGEYLTDFLSGYLSYTGKGFIRRVIAGDFSARFGQGMNINTGIHTGLSLTAPGYFAARNEIRPYTSTDENNFFRGAAAQFSLKKAGITLFISHNKIDATTSAIDDSAMLIAERFYETGLHNTASLMLKKDAVTETSYGINLTYNFRYVKAGLCWSESRLSLPLIPEKKDPENLYAFSGTRCTLFSGYYSSLINRLLLYGEFSLNDLHNYAMVQGAALKPSDRLTVNFLFRNYTPGYSSFHSNGPGSNSSNNNVQGILGNFIFEAARHLFISAGCDISHSPWLKYRTSFPSLARRTEIKLQYNPLENLTFNLSYNIRYALVNDDHGSGIAGIEEIKSRTLKGQVKYGFNERVSFLTRIDYKVADPSGSDGMLFLQDVVYNFTQVPVTLWFRYCIFNTDDWNSRLYTYENDLLNCFSIPALSGKGTRSYMMLKWEFGNRAELRLKYALTSLTTDKYTTEDKDEFKLQFRIWF